VLVEPIGRVLVVAMEDQDVRLEENITPGPAGVGVHEDMDVRAKEINAHVPAAVHVQEDMHGREHAGLHIKFPCFGLLAISIDGAFSFERINDLWRI
jgi:hypothetical protein